MNRRDPIKYIILGAFWMIVMIMSIPIIIKLFIKASEFLNG